MTQTSSKKQVSEKIVHKEGVQLISKKVSTPTGLYTDEWIIESGIDQGLTKANCHRMLGGMKIAGLLNWKGSSFKSCWYTKSIDIHTGKTSNYGQAKPSNPRTGDDGKIIRYETFPRYQPKEVIFLNPVPSTWDKVHERYPDVFHSVDVIQGRDDEGFWQHVIDRPELPVILTEGIKKAAVLLTHGYVAVCAAGVWGGLTKGDKELTPAMRLLAQPGRKFILAFDADIVKKKEVLRAFKETVRRLNEAGCTVSIVNWHLDLGKGVDDFIVKHGVQAWEEIMEQEWTFDSFIDHLEEKYPEVAKEHKKKVTAKEEKKNKSKFLQVKDCIHEAYKGRVRFSVYGDLVYLDGKLLEKVADFFNRTYQLCCEQLGFDPVDKHVERALDLLFEDNRFNPVVEYLQAVQPLKSVGAIQRLAVEGMGLPTQFQQFLFRKQLIASVARAMKPGVQVDSVGVIYGCQGARKTTLLQILGGDLYRFLDGATNDKDTRMIASQGWILEWGEIETCFGKKATSQMKAFITERKDNYRPPYGKKLDILNEARKYTLWGSTNEQELLSDPTGTRRFWMMHQRKKLDIDFAKKLRDEVWSEAYNAYLAGEKWYLNSDEELWLEDNNREYLQGSVWDEDIGYFLHQKATNEYFTINDVFKYLEFLNVNKDDSKRHKIRNSLLRAGCKQKVTTIDGVSGRYWFKPAHNDLPELHLDTVVGGVVEGVVAETPMVEGKTTHYTKNTENLDNFSNQSVLVPPLTEDDPQPFGKNKDEKTEILVSSVVNPVTEPVSATTPPTTPPTTPIPVVDEEQEQLELLEAIEEDRKLNLLFPTSWNELRRQYD